MEKREYTVYKFDELPADKQKKAIENLYDINVDHDWWDSTYDDANRIGLRITEFDLEGTCKGNFIESAEETAYKIEKEHGEQCETYKTAKKYLASRDNVIEMAERDESGNFVDEYEVDKDLDELDAEFLRDLLEDYRIILQNEYDYLTSEEAIIETIKANDYNFTENGKID